jgi:WD40 repeat protein
LVTLDGDEAEPQRVSDFTGTIQSLAFARRDGLFVSSGWSRLEVVVWKPDSPADERTFPKLLAGEAATGGVYNVAASPDGALIAVVNGTGRGVNVFDLASGRRLLTLPDENGSVWWLAWSPDSRRLAVSRSEGDISVWDVGKGQAVLDEAGLGVGPEAR